MLRDCIAGGGGGDWMSDLAQQLFDQAVALNMQWQRGYTHGLKVGRDEALQPILAAYDKALADPETKMPSYLMAALEASRG